MANELSDSWKRPSDDGSTVLFELLFLNIVARALKLVCKCGQ